MFADLKTVHIVQKHHCKQMGKDVIVHKIVWLYLVSTYVGSNFNTYYLFSIVYLANKTQCYFFIHVVDL
jgi:hypothetical protein